MGLINVNRVHAKTGEVSIAKLQTKLHSSKGARENVGDHCHVSSSSPLSVLARTRMSMCVCVCVGGGVYNCSLSRFIISSLSF